MAGIPLSLAIPAATASLAYLNAKHSFSSDLHLLQSAVRGQIATKRSEGKNTLNLFYELENHAQATKTRNRSFIAIPPSIPKDVQKPEDLRGLQCIEYTYKTVYETVLQYAAWLRTEHGIKKGDIVAMNITNKAQFIFVWFAIWSLGAKAAFINTGLRGEALLHCVKASTARLLILDPELQEAIPPIQNELGNASVTTVVVDDGVERRVKDTAGYRAPDSDRAGAKGSDLAVLIFTSGTTGLPKPAIVPWRKFYASSKSMALWLGVKPTDRYYTAMPLYHSSATILGLSVALNAGACFIISNHFSPRTFFASVTASKATMMQYIGEMCRYLVSMPPSKFDTSHRLRIAFGNGLRPDVWDTFKNRFNITEIGEFYSATEAVGGSFVKSKNDFGRGAVGRSGTLVKFLYGSTVVTVKHDVETGEPWRNPKTGFCEKVELGEAGELLNKLDPANIHEKYVGYFNNDKASNSKILRDVLEKGDAWYRSGDLLKSDHEGRAYFVDRIGDTFRWKSENVSTNEVAEIFATSPAVEEVNIYGVALPNHDGRAGCAALILKPTSSDKNEKEVMKDLAKHARDRLPRYAVPLFLRVVKQFEVTGTNKYTKHGLRTEGVDPEKTGGDVVFWLPPGAEGYQRFGKRDWEGIVGGGVKL